MGIRTTLSIAKERSFEFISLLQSKLGCTYAKSDLVLVHINLRETDIEDEIDQFVSFFLITGVVLILIAISDAASSRVVSLI
jgi:hypothetical protein